MSSIAAKNILDDYERLLSGRADVFVIACDGPIYDSLRGNRRDPRGRKAALEAGVASELLPGVANLPIGEVSDVQEIVSERFGRLRVLGCRAATGVAVERVLLATWAVSPTVEADPDIERVRAILRQHPTSTASRRAPFPSSVVRFLLRPFRPRSWQAVQRPCPAPSDDGIVVGVTSVYILRCADNTFYVGHTDSVAERLLAHNAGSASRYTAARRPVVLVYSEAAPTLGAAIRREKQLQRWSGLKKEALVSGDLVELKALSRSRQNSRHGQRGV